MSKVSGWKKRVGWGTGQDWQGEKVRKEKVTRKGKNSINCEYCHSNSVFIAPSFIFLHAAF